MSDATTPDNQPPVGEPPAGTPARDTVGLGTRFGARFIDGLIVGLPVYVVLLVLPGLSPGGFVGGVVTGIAYLAYFVYFEGTTGKTLGKGLLNIEVVSDDGSALSFDNALRRNWWTGLSIISGIPVIGVLVGLASLAIAIYIAVTISGDARNRGWHDQLGGTLVVRTG